MADLPVHSDTGDEGGAENSEQPLTGPASRQKVLWAVVGVSVLAVFVVLHLTGVLGAGSHG